MDVGWMIVLAFVGFGLAYIVRKVQLDAARGALADARGELRRMRESRDRCVSQLAERTEYVLTLQRELKDATARARVRGAVLLQIEKALDDRPDEGATS